MFAGGEDGSVVLWDLREPSAMHRSLVEGVELLGRPPTFSTGEWLVLLYLIQLRLNIP